MLMSVIEGALSAPAYPELAGKRILITGLTSRCGVDIARAFADHKGRLVLQFAEASEAMQTVAEIVAPSALETRVYGPVGADVAHVADFAKTAVQAFGGLDAVINVVPLEARGLAPSASCADVEALIAAQLKLPLLVSKIAANRMSLVWAEGLVLNVGVLTSKPSGAARAFATVAKAGLTALTRGQAEEWASRGIRFNAVAPQTAQGTGADLRGEPDVASLALYLASARGKGLSGCVFEAAMS
jgi:3-oxoacyl-[acyl-carrier protein] reductase